MTREEAIKRLKEIDIRDALQEDYDALYMAIEALEQERSRLAQITQYRNDCEKLMQENEQLKKALEQEPKTGHWFVDERPESDREIICSNCEQPIFRYHKLDFDYRPKYCPSCGARMER